MSIVEDLLICSSVFALLAVTFGSIEIKTSDPTGEDLDQHLKQTRRWGQYALCISTGVVFAWAGFPA
jgi:hypothetical protein|nr:hypothetical protein [Oxalobacteraceae bacterium]